MQSEPMGMGPHVSTGGTGHRDGAIGTGHPVAVYTSREIPPSCDVGYRYKYNHTLLLISFQMCLFPLCVLS